MNGEEVKFREMETILKVTLNAPILPHSTVIFEMEFAGQVPVQIRRSGRDNAEGVRYSMSQWYPKMSNYDEQGWHANSYIGGEFYGIWGDFDVKITIDKTYILGGTGYLRNASEVGYGYEEAGDKVAPPIGKTLTWHFVAPKVHDFMWAADPQFKHDKIETANGVTIHHLYIPSEKTRNWEILKEYTPKAIEFLSGKFGQYPYKQFSVIQGGDGGMEYPMATLITGERNLSSLVGVMIHELAHAWFAGVLATNEGLYAWMDEGFSSYAASLAKSAVFQPVKNPMRDAYSAYYRLVKSGYEEPLSTHADHFQFHSSYVSASYSKGAVFLAQLGYVIGDEARDRAMLRYYEKWKFRHPNANDLIRSMEMESEIELDWYKEYFVYTTKTINYGIKEVKAIGAITEITLERIGLMPMPVDLVISYKDGTSELIYLPLPMMRGEKVAEKDMPARTHIEPWPWTSLTKTFMLNKELKLIKSVEIDPSRRLADVVLENNKVEF